MPVVMSESLRNKLDRVQTRDWWPVAELARVLGCSKQFVYNKAGAGHFDVVNDIGYMRIDSRSVVKYFSEEHKQIV